MAERGGLQIDAINALQVHTKQWVSYIPIVTATVGNLVSYVANGVYYKLNKIIFLRIAMRIIDAGAAGGFIVVTLPFPAEPFDMTPDGIATQVGGVVLSGRDLNFNKTVTGYTSITDLTTNEIAYADGSWPGATGTSLRLMGFYGTK